MRTTNAKSHEQTTRRETFKANNLFAEIQNGHYVVYSYGYHFPIYAYINGTWIKNVDKYSVTTSKQMTQSKPDISWVGQSEFVEMDTMQLKNAIVNK